MREEDLETPAGQMAVSAARLVARMSDAPGAWDFLEEFEPLQRLFDLQARAQENALTQTSASAEEGRRLYLYKRGVELANAIREAKLLVHTRAPGTKP
jgi:hypothetical protein